MRKTAKYVVAEEGRDKGKTFIITEMPASKAEAWAVKAILALMEGNVQIPEGFENMGMAGMAEIGIRALSGLKWEVAEPLLNEMWQCVQIMPDPARTNIIRDLIEEDIEEVMTRIKIRLEIWNLHTDFLKAAVNSGSGVSTAATTKATPTTKTSRRA
jgi:hypothetical protein